MIRRWMATALLLATAVAASGCAVQWRERHAHPGYDAAADLGFYFDDLAPYGTWVELSPYGWVWCPLDTPIGWRPYTVGYWVYSDDGWFWISEDPWGWVPYHYGRWAWDHDYGWVWVPDDEWAPAWVAWRYGDGWIGWAALPPDVHWRSGVGLVYSAYDLDRHINRHRWCFVPARDFGPSRTRERVRVEPMSRNVTLLKETRNVTKYRAAPRPVETGMDPAIIRERGHAPIKRYKIVDAPRSLRERGVEIGEGSIEVYRPRTGVTEVVRERVRNVPPEERPVAPSQVIERIEKKREQLPEAVKTQRERLEQEHEREMEQRRPGESALELRRKQEAELRAQREAEEREKRVLEEREKRAVQQRERAERETDREAQLREKAQAAKERAARLEEAKARQQELKAKQEEQRSQQREREAKEPPKRERDPRTGR